MIDLAYTNKIVTAVDSVVIVRKTPAFSGKKIVSVKSGEVIGRASGTTFNMADGKWICVNLSNPVGEDKYGYVAELYKGKPNVKLGDPASSPVAEKSAQELLDNIVETDKAVFTKLLNCYKIIVDLKKRNITIPDNISKNMVAVYISLSNRQEKLKNIKGTEVKTGKPRDIDSATNLSNMVANTHNVRGIGWIQILVIVIAIIIGAASAAAVYYATKPDYEDSKRDLKISSDLEKALSTLTPRERQNVETDLEKQVDDAYNAGKTKQKLSDIFGGGLLKTGLIVGGAFLIGKEIFKHKKQKNG